MNTKKLLTLVAGLSFGILASVANAQEEAGPTPRGPALDKIIFQASAEKWVQTSQANVIVSVDASLEKDSLAKLRKKIEDNLQSIAKAEWRITQVNRSQDSSGLEKLNVVAEARVNESALTNINQQAKDLSKPGVTYKIDRIDFTPSLVETEKTRNEVRAMIYQQINDEISALQKAYPKQNYTVNVIDFIGTISPVAKEGGPVGAAPMMVAAPSSAGGTISVSNKVEMTATVVLAATRPNDHSKTKKEE